MNFLDSLILSDTRPEAFDNIQTYAVDTSNNTIIVWLQNYCEDEIARFRETILDSQIITFEESRGVSIFLDATGNNHSEINLWTWTILGIILLLSIFLAIFFWQRKRSIPTMQLINGDITVGSTPISRSQVVEIAKNREGVPKARDDLFADIIEKIEKNES